MFTEKNNTMSKIKTPITTLAAIVAAVKEGKTVYCGNLYYEVKPKGDDYVIKCGNGPTGTRLKFPQVSPDLKTRWCSAYLKIDICATAIRNQERFRGIKTMVISGERGEESSARAKYKEIEPDRSHLKDKRVVDRVRLIKNWTETEVWAIIEKYKIRVHPCYYMGWSRCSCKFCIFGNANQFKSAQTLSPDQFNQLSKYEDQFDTTIKRDRSLNDLIKDGKPYEGITDDLKQLSTSKEYTLPITMDIWYLPLGAYGESCGPI